MRTNWSGEANALCNFLLRTHQKALSGSCTVRKTTLLHPPLRLHNIQNNLNGLRGNTNKQSRDTQMQHDKHDDETKNKIGKWKVRSNGRCWGIEKEDELEWGEENALNLNYGAEKPQDIKRRNVQEEGNEAKIGAGSTWPTHTKALARGKAVRYQSQQAYSSTGQDCYRGVLASVSRLRAKEIRGTQLFT